MTTCIVCLVAWVVVGLLVSLIFCTGSNVYRVHRGKVLATCVPGWPLVLLLCLAIGISDLRDG